VEQHLNACVVRGRFDYHDYRLIFCRIAVVFRCDSSCLTEHPHPVLRVPYWYSTVHVTCHVGRCSLYTTCYITTVFCCGWSRSPTVWVSVLLLNTARTRTHPVRYRVALPACLPPDLPASFFTTYRSRVTVTLRWCRLPAVVAAHHRLPNVTVPGDCVAQFDTCYRYRYREFHDFVVWSVCHWWVPRWCILRLFTFRTVALDWNRYVRSWWKKPTTAFTSGGCIW